LAAHQLRYSVLPGSFAICRLTPDAAVPEWATASKFFSITRTANELSIVGEQERVPAGVLSEGGWACIRLEGPFPFALTGVLAAILNPLARAGIAIFAVSTFDTDCILIQSDRLPSAEQALRQAGHERIPEANSPQ
jgi:hypothetical protein